MVIKVEFLDVFYLFVVVWVFYFGLFCGRELNLVFVFDFKIVGDLVFDMVLDLVLLWVLYLGERLIE